MRLGGKSETAYGHATVLPPYTVLERSISAFRGPLCFPAKNRDQKREQFHHRRKWEMTHFRSSPNSFYAICGGNWGGALDQWQLFKHVFLTFLLSPLSRGFFFFEFVDGKPSVVISYFFRYSFFFAAEANSGTKRTAQFFLFSPIFPTLLTQLIFFRWVCTENWLVLWAKEVGSEGKKDPFTLENCGHTTPPFSIRLLTQISVRLFRREIDDKFLFFPGWQGDFFSLFPH